MLSVAVYGFGSAFNKGQCAADIDLLIVHSNTRPSSCKLAIKCKQRLSERIGQADITMLSAEEEAHFKFIRSARAKFLGTLCEELLQNDIEAIISQIA